MRSASVSSLQGFVCDGSAPTSGDFFFCPPGQFLEVDLLGPSPTLVCLNIDGVCPGSYHFGCDGGDFGALTTVEPTTENGETTEGATEATTTTAGAGVPALGSSVFLALISHRISKIL